MDTRVGDVLITRGTSSYPSALAQERSASEQAGSNVVGPRLFLSLVLARGARALPACWKFDLLGCRHLGIRARKVGRNRRKKRREKESDVSTARARQRQLAE